MTEHAVQEAPQASTDAEKPSRTKRFGRFLVWYVGWERLKKNAAIVRNRASMPLLRQVLKSARSGYTPTPAADLETDVLARSVFGHGFILVVAIPALLWTLMNLGRGIALLVQYGRIGTNDYLLVSVPLTLYLGMRILISAKSLSVFRNELSSREAQGRQS
ncbi:hypothetical protein [Pseudomonas sp. NPDC096950]|uniref:hypothetical protein n=1 Tax=Pseudomonas sp. NPDC096950 TaxID=3364485 RepID=UPI00383BECE4